MSARTEISARYKLRKVARALSLDTQKRLMIWALIAADGIALTCAFAAAYVLRFVFAIALEGEVGGGLTFYSTVVLTLIPTWLLIFLVIGLYEEHNLLGGTKEYSLVFSGVSTGMLVVIFVTFVDPDFTIARGWLVYAWLLAFLFVAASRFSLRRVIYHLRGRGYFLSPALIVGANEEGIALAQQLAGWRSSGLNVLGFVTAEANDERIFRNLYSLGTMRDLPRLVDSFQVREIVVATSAVSRQDLVEIFRNFSPRPEVQLRLSSGLFEILTTGLSIKEINYVPLVNVDPVRLTGIDKVLKAALDYSVASAVIALGAPIYLAVAIAVKLDSPGSVFHRRRVLGQAGEPFDCFKFRSMVAHGDNVLADSPHLAAELAARHKIKDDPRVTRLGRILRKTSLDELPQMFNVLLGQMSVVGPRMISPEEHERYGQWDMNLLTVKPGITGLWQVSGRSETSYEERVQLDMNYIRNWTIWLDIQLLLQTIPAVLRGRGAY